MRGAVMAECLLGPLVVGGAAAVLTKPVGIVRIGRVKVELGWVAGVVAAVSGLRVAKRPDVALHTCGFRGVTRGVTLNAAL